MRHYGYDIAENTDGQIFADVKRDGEYHVGEDALLIRNSAKQGDPLSTSELKLLDLDGDGYLSRDEMRKASLSIWIDRDHDGEIGRGDGVVEMASEGSRQAIVDLDAQRLEVRVRRNALSRR